MSAPVDADAAARWLELMTGWPVEAGCDPHIGLALVAVSPDAIVEGKRVMLWMLHPLDFMEAK